jgi:disulfide bond formation protein DsbB
MSERGSSIGAVPDRLILLAMLAVLAAILTAAMVMQYALGEIPCPLCLLQRVAMFGCCFGLIRQLHAGGSERGTGIALIFAVLLLVISVRQTLLDIYPRSGHDYVGSAIFGLHLPVWSVLVAVALLLGLAARLALFGGSHSTTTNEGALPRVLVRPLVIYVVVICAINFVSVVAQCGLGQCHTSSYRLFQ